MAERSGESASFADHLRRNLLVRQAPVTALLILLGVCVVSLVAALHQPLVLVTALPLVAVLVVYAVRTRSQ